eukprot:TRINITY_DN92099_c0_g1_i1.p1 TRINITY_DN92099_c0_g1~~TRINITY_DN92099_c0_g1_i1.p1  ORF type:complete len:198 (-),score=20.02 TRINITY_DN92099_c0_g1_i1:74-667(-)
MTRCWWFLLVALASVQVDALAEEKKMAKSSFGTSGHIRRERYRRSIDADGTVADAGNEPTGNSSQAMKGSSENVSVIYPDMHRLPVNMTINRGQVTSATCVIGYAKYCSGAGDVVRVADLTECRYRCLAKAEPSCTYAVYYGANTMSGDCQIQASDGNCVLYSMPECHQRTSTCPVAKGLEDQVYIIQKKEGTAKCS